MPLDLNNANVEILRDFALTWYNWQIANCDLSEDVNEQVRHEYALREAAVYVAMACNQNSTKGLWPRDVMR